MNCAISIRGFKLYINACAICGNLHSSSRQRTEGFIHLLKKLARVNANDSVLYFVDDTYIARTSVLGNCALRMREQNTMKVVPLDVVPERRTEQCSPRFRCGDRFCELWFRYQSSPTGSEGEISPPYTIADRSLSSTQVD